MHRAEILSCYAHHVVPCTAVARALVVPALLHGLAHALSIFPAVVFVKV